MVPGTALGVLAGDLAYTLLAVRLARQSGRRDVTAMPFGIDTPSLFGMTFGVIGPTMLLTRDPVLAWKVGMGATVAMGVVKLLLAFAGEWVRRDGAAGGAARVHRGRGHRADRLPARAPHRRRPAGRPGGPGADPGQLRRPDHAARPDPGGAGGRARRGRGARAPARSRSRGGRARGRAAVEFLAAGHPVADAGLARRRARDVGCAAGSLAVRPGDRHRGHRQHRERDRGRRPLPDARHPPDRGARDDPGGPVRRRHPEHAVHRPPRVQGHGGPGRLHAGHRPGDRPRRDGRRRLRAHRRPPRGGARSRSSSSSAWRSPARPSSPRPRDTRRPWRSPSSP